MLFDKNLIITFWDTLRYFQKHEFTCPCGCLLNNINEDFVSRLHQARLLAKVPFSLNSACRCKKHNSSKDVKGSDTSSHLKGLGVDIAVSNSLNRMKIVNSLLSVGFKRIGIYKNFIHVDYDLTKIQNVIWYK